MSPNLGCLVPLPTMQGNLQSVLHPSRFQLAIDSRFPRFQRVSQEALTPPQHSDESRQANQHPPRDAICRIKSNICDEQTIYFMDAD